MSTWIHITNLPLYYDDYGLQDIFGDIGQIIATKVTKNEMILKSTGFVQFTSTKHAKLAASKKDQTVIANSAVRVYLIWTQDEDLSTVRVENFPDDATETDLEKYFDPYGEIVNITIQTLSNSNDQYALVSFCRVDYALNAVQEMDGTIIGMCGSLKVTLVNPDARNLKWKRNSFEYKRLQIPSIHEIHEHNSDHNNRSAHYHRHKHHHHGPNRMKQQYQTNNNASIIIVNNINSVHSTINHENDDSKAMQNDSLRPQYGAPRGRSHFNVDKRSRGRHRNYRQSHHNQEDRYHRNKHRHHNNHDNNNDHHHHYAHNRRNPKRYHEENHHNRKQHTRKPRKYRSGRSVTSQSTLLGPLHNFSNGQYHTYSVTPSPQSPTRSHIDAHDTMNDSLSSDHMSRLQRMNSTDSSSSSCSAQSLPNCNYPQMKRTALDRYGFPSKQVQNHHSPQPYQPVPQQMQYTPHTPLSPATSVSTPSTTHSMPTPTGYIAQTFISRSKTPTPLIIPTPTVSKSSTTPISSTPPAASCIKYPVNPVFTPHTNMNRMNMNVITNGFSNMSMISPSTLVLPLDTIHNNANKSPQSVTSPIVLTPSTNLLIQQHLVSHNPNMLSPPNLQGPFVYNSSPSTLQGTPPDPQTNVSHLSSPTISSSSKKGKKSPSHSWTKEEEELGNKCYRIIETKYPQRATKITGMLLTANKIDDIKFMMERPYILLALASDYDKQQRIKELNKHK